MFLCVLDFEATCEKNSNYHEVIEFPSVIVDVENRAILDERFDVFVKPLKKPVVSTFCNELTGITQEQVDAGISFPEALKCHRYFLKKYHPNIIVTCGDWDLKTMMPIEIANHKIDKNDAKQYNKWINIKKEFAAFYEKTPECMMGMLKSLKLTHEGRHHSGIDDCYNIAKICVKMLEDGWIPDLA